MRHHPHEDRNSFFHGDLHKFTGKMESSMVESTNKPNSINAVNFVPWLNEAPDVRGGRVAG